MSKSLPEINKCPICNNKKNEIRIAEENYFIYCPFCNASSSKFALITDAINAWNNIAKPIQCPFCGSKNATHNKIDGWGTTAFILCPACGATGPSQFDTIEAIEAWNARYKGEE